MKRREVTEESFLKDVSSHRMSIIRDHGVHRHLRFAKPESGNMHFDIVTYPHYLVYSGDMGCYVFSRINDMFEFFRRPNGPLEINEGYWSEKLEATDRPDGHVEYDPERARTYVQAWLDNQREEAKQLAEENDEAFNQEAFEELRERLDKEVIGRVDDHEFFFRDALRDFEHDNRHPFEDSWEVNFDSYTFRFQWCCFALVWAIRQYDELKAESAKQP